MKMFKFDTMRFIKVVNYPYYFWHRYILNPDFFRGAEVVKTFNYSRAIMQFCYAMAKKDLLSDCPIDQNSVVLDIGGHTGEWAEKIVNKYDPFMHIFEPLPPSFEKLEKKFQHKEKVHMYSFGVADQNRTATLSMYGKGSSIYSDCPSYSINPNTIDVSLKDIYEIVESHKFNFVDLIKINIEGGGISADRKNSGFKYY